MGSVKINQLEAQNEYIKGLVKYIQSAEELSKDQITAIVGRSKALGLFTLLYLTEGAISEVEELLKLHFGEQKLAQFQQQLLEQAEIAMTR